MFPEKRRRSVWWLASFIGICLGVLSWSYPVLAVPNNPSGQTPTAISPQLEAEVLQIIRNHPEVIIESIQAYQQQQKRQQAQIRQSRLEALKRDPKSAIASSPQTGATNQRLVLFEFSDFQCPYCAQAHSIIKEFMQKHGDQVTLVYKHYPLPFHPEARPAAKAAWAAGQQGKFWPFHDALFTHQDQLGEALYLKTARDLQLDLEQFNRDRQGEAAEAAILQDIKLGESLGIEGTPFLVLNGKSFSGAVPLSELEAAL